MRPVIIAVFCLTACSSIPLRSMIELSRFDALTADPSGIAVAVDLSDGLQAAPDKTILTLAANGPDAQTLHEDFTLKQTREIVDGSPRTAFVINPLDIQRLTATRSKIAAWKQQDPKTSGSLSVNAEPCRTASADPSAPQFIEIFFRTAADRPFIVMTPKTEVRKTALEGVEIPLCKA